MCDRLEALLARWDLAGDRWLLHGLARLLFPAPPSAGIRHIVVYRVGNIGDTVVAIPTLQAIRHAYPQATITLLTSAGNAELPGAADVLAPFPGLVNRIVSYLPAEIKRPTGLNRLKAQIMEAGPVDWFVDLPVSMQTFRRGLQELFLARWLGSRTATGFDMLLPEIFKSAYARRYLARIPRTSDWLLSLVTSVLPGMQGASTPIACQTPSPDWKSLDLNPDRPILAVNAGAKLAIKRWPASHFSECVQHVQARFPELQVALLGHGGEKTLNDEIAANLSGNIFNLAGRLDLAQTWALLARATAVLSNDTGTMHMAGLLNKPVVAPMSGQYPQNLWHPPGDNFSGLRHPVPCAPCFKDTCPFPEQTCLTRISPLEVAESLAQTLEAHTRSL